MAERQPPDGFVDSPHPPITGRARLASRTEETTIERPLAVVLASLDGTPLEETIVAAGALPGVAGTRVLTPGAYGEPGSRHLVFLTDGATVVEQVLENTRTEASYRLRYIAWNYTAKAARPLRYGLGEFLYAAAGDRTHVTWTYAFELRPNRFPGFLGVPLGASVLKMAVLNGPYSRWMQASLRRIKANAEAWAG